MERPLFELGSLNATPGLLAAVAHDEVLNALSRHVRGDWGELGAEDKAANNAALKDGSRILSAYRSTAGTKFWIITEGDRSYTTVLLPEEY